LIGGPTILGSGWLTARPTGGLAGGGPARRKSRKGAVGRPAPPPAWPAYRLAGSWPGSGQSGGGASPCGGGQPEVGQTVGAYSPVSGSAPVERGDGRPVGREAPYRLSPSP